MEHKCAQQSQRNRNPPHTDRETVHVKKRISPAIQNAVDCDRIHASSDHVDAHDNHHAGQIALRFLRQDHHPHNQRGQRQNKRCRSEPDHPGDILQADSVSFPALQSSGAEFISDHNPGGAADTVAGAADQVADYGRHRICRGGVRAHMSHDRRIGSKSDAPEQSAAQKRQALPSEINGQQAVQREKPVPGRADITAPEADDQAQDKFQNSGQGRRKSRASRLHGRQAEQSEDE